MDPLHGNGYAFWSGIGNDLPVFLIGYVPAVTLWYFHSRCHVEKCLRRGRYPFHHYRLCVKHHPKVPQGGVKHWQIIKIHKEGTKRNG